MRHIKIYESFTTESGHWDGQGHWVEDKPQADKNNYHKGFDKCPCVKKQGWSGLDLDKDGVIEIISPGAVGGDKRYKPDGVLELWKTKSDGTAEITKSTYSCNGDKVIDGFVQNPKTWKTYKGNKPPFVKKGLIEYIPEYTQDGPGQDVIKKMQQKLIDAGKLKIKAPTGNYGKMTIQAVKDFGTGDDVTNSYMGITRNLYNTLMGIR
jgi:hypothetical protein